MPTPWTTLMTHIDDFRMSEANGGVRFERSLIDVLGASEAGALARNAVALEASS